MDAFDDATGDTGEMGQMTSSEPTMAEPSPRVPGPRVPGPRVPGLPRHVAIIMDGNGRWAAERGLPRTQGHRRGVEAVRRVVRRAAELNLEYLTLFAFSSENWARPVTEVRELMRLLRRFIRQDLAEIHQQGIRLVMIGSRDKVDPQTMGLIEESEQLTRNNTRMTLVMAFNYGSKDEIVRAAQALVAEAAAGRLSADEVTCERLAGHLDTRGIPDPDLLIRTSGEQRLSNFLLWQAAYTEFLFVDTFWPDFGAAELDAALAEYAKRDRRYGGLQATAGR